MASHICSRPPRAGQAHKTSGSMAHDGRFGDPFWPFVVYAIIQGGRSIQTAFILVIALLTVCLAYPLFLTFTKDAKAMVDPAKEGLASDR